MHTVEPPNKGHVGTRSFVFYREVSFILRLKCTGIIGIGTSRFVLYREVFFIRSEVPLYIVALHAEDYVNRTFEFICLIRWNAHSDPFKNSCFLNTQF